MQKKSHLAVTDGIQAIGKIMRQHRHGDGDAHGPAGLEADADGKPVQEAVDREAARRRPGAPRIATAPRVAAHVPAANGPAAGTAGTPVPRSPVSRAAPAPRVPPWQRPVPRLRAADRRRPRRSRHRR